MRQQGPRLLPLQRSTPGDIVEVKFGKPWAKGRLECVACYHAKAEERGISLCVGRACRATRAKYGLADGVGSESASKREPSPRHPVATLKTRKQVGLDEVKQMCARLTVKAREQGQDVEILQQGMRRMEKELRSVTAELRSQRARLPSGRGNRDPDPKPKAAKTVRRSREPERQPKRRRYD